MAESDSIEAKTPFGTVVAHGATVVLMVLMLAIGVFLVQLGQKLNEHDAAAAIADQKNAASRIKLAEAIGQQVAQTEYQNMLLRAICYRLSDNKTQALQCEPRYKGYTEPTTQEEELRYYDKKK